MKLLTIIGARPQIIKAAAVSRVIRAKFDDQINEILVHTGQHYDDAMSDIFFRELALPEPDYNLGVKSDTHARQTGAVMIQLEKIISGEKPDAMLLYGDTNATLAGALVGSKSNVPVIHVEAGLRSFNKNMPEEINRITCDHASALLFAPTTTAFTNLLKEGFSKDNLPPYTGANPKIYHCGDVMFDNSLHYAGVAKKESTLLQRFSLRPDKFILATVHRDLNTDSAERLSHIFAGLLRIAGESTVLLPLHPRTKKNLELLSKPLLEQIENQKNFVFCEPLSFLDMIMAETSCQMVITDSGGVQKEASFFRKPCIILRPETEWVELTSSGVATLCDADPEKIYRAFSAYSSQPSTGYPEIFGDGHAAEFICSEIIKHFGHAAAVRA